jgi:transcriptional regulator with XRE-family HTH domain
MKFSEYLKTKRMKINESLRAFCLENNLDAGNISKLERGVMAPPKDISKIANALGFKLGDAEYAEMEDIAEKTRAVEHFSRVSEDVAERLPQFFRTVDNANLTEEKLNQMIGFLLKEEE